MSAEIASAAAERAEVLIALHRYVEARALLGAAIAAAPAEPGPWCLLAQACLGADDPEAALDAATHAAALDPDEEWPHRLRSHALERLDRPADSVAAAHEAVRREPYLWATHARLADALSSEVATYPGPAWSDRALGSARTALELAPDEPSAYAVLAQVHTQRQEWPDMAAAEAEAVGLAPDDANLHNNMAVNRLRVEHLVHAGAGFARAAALDPKGPGARNFGLTCRALFDHRIRKAVFALWLGGFVARGIGHGQDGLTMRLWAAVAVGAIGWFLLRPIAEFVRAVGPHHRRALAAALRRNRRLSVQAAAMSVSFLLSLVSLALPTSVIAATVLVAIGCYGVTAVLTWFDRSGDRVIHGDPSRR